MSTTTLNIHSSLSKASGSLNGHRITVGANGLPNKVDKYLSVKIICANYSLNLPIISLTPKLVTFQTIKSDIDQTCNINVTYETTFSTLSYTYKTVETPKSTITPATGIDTYTITSNFTVDRV